MGWSVWTWRRRFKRSGNGFSLWPCRRSGFKVTGALSLAQASAQSSWALPPGSLWPGLPLPFSSVPGRCESDTVIHIRRRTRKSPAGSPGGRRLGASAAWQSMVERLTLATLTESDTANSSLIAGSEPTSPRNWDALPISQPQPIHVRPRYPALSVKLSTPPRHTERAAYCSG